MKDKEERAQAEVLSSEKWRKVKDIFLDALELDEPEREIFLRTNCVDDPEIRNEVNKLLGVHIPSTNFIENPAAEIASIFQTNGNATQPKHFGQYKIIREIGAGGMGAVFLAERDDGEFTQQVAIKIVRQAVAEKDLINRFRQERQILASLNHPFIAKLFDGGISETGEPFLVMEYVDGVPLLEFAGDLDTEARLRLFLRICSAVSYAHRNLIVHRDIKPSNVLVTRDGEPKLLDFGLAKLSEPAANAGVSDTTQTAFHAMTPAYASPEQLRGEQVTTASDVYSLGVVLYELLTEKRPFDFQGKSLEQIIRTVTELQPSLPSQVVSSKLLASNLRNDLDKIVLMALRKEPERRYISVEAFAEDIERHLNNLPVRARPHTFKYRALKFIRRNKVTAAAATLIFSTLLGGIATTAWQARRAAEQAALAEQEAETARTEREKAEQALVRAEKSKKFLQDILSYANPAWYSRGVGNNDMTVIEAIEDAESRIDTELADFPEVRADLHFTLGEIYFVRRDDASKGSVFFEKARGHLTECLRLRREIYGEHNEKTAEAYYFYAGIYFSEPDKIIFYLRKALEIYRNTDPEDANVPYLLLDLGGQLIYVNEFDEAERLVQDALTILRRKNGDRHLSVAFAMKPLSRIAIARAQFEKAELLLRQALAIAGTQNKQATLEFLSDLKKLYEARADKTKAAEVKLEMARLEQE